MENKVSGKTRFNIIDLLIILLILVVAAAVIYASAISDKISSKDDVSVTYVLRMTNVKEEYLPLIKAGETLYDSVSGAPIGEIKSITASHSKFTGESVPSADATEAVVSEYEHEYDIFITLGVTADINERGIACIGENKILVGSKFYVRSGAFAGTGFCTDFSIEN